MDPMNPSRPGWLAIVVFPVLLAACSSSPAWDKAGASETTTQNDSNDCRVQARLAPLPERYTGSPTASVTSRVMSREEERAMFESQEFQKCMMAKGYAKR
jgi:succinylarginine dihydrolase